METIPTEINLDLFYVKGTSYKSLKDFMEKQLGYDYVAKKMKEFDPKFNGSFLASSKYPAMVNMNLAKSSAKELGMEFKDFCVKFNEENVRNGLNSIFKFLLKNVAGGALRVLKSTPQMIKGYTNAMNYDIVTNDKYFHEALVHSPEVFYDWNVFLFEGGIYGILNELGNKVTRFDIKKESEEIIDGVKWIHSRFVLEYI